jgi:hypothetical protein
MATVIWGLLEKSQTDDEKIEEAINRLIAAHNANESAHLGAGQSLQSHKASEIIDHLVDSIIADKIAPREVPLDKLDFDRFIFLTMFESLSPWYQTKTGGRGIIELLGPSVHIVSGNQTNDIASIQLITSPLNVGEDTDPYFAVSVLMPDVAGANAYVWIETSNATGVNAHYGFGFLYDRSDGKLYAYWGNGSAQAMHDTGVTDFGSVLGLKAYYDSTANILNFYVNNSLVWTVSPTALTCGNDPMLSIGQKSASAAAGPDLYIYNAVFSQKF